MAALPRPYRFVAKRELLDHWLPRIYLTRLGTCFVERSDPLQSTADASRLPQVIAAGHSLAVFPEGTFTRRPGLLPFHLGAFAAAVTTDAAIVPVAVCGSRQALPDGEWMPHPSPVSLVICQPLPADSALGEDFAKSIRLRDQAKDWIAKKCGEPA